MPHHVVLTVHLHDRRYHGVPEWPPSPARIFQALVSGVARGSLLPARHRAALEWLEQLPAPAIAAPRAWSGQPIETYVPNNDADALAGDLTRIGEIRTKKSIKPYLLEGDDPFIYAWLVERPTQEVEHFIEAADQLYQFGRGVDMAWAAAEVVEDDTLVEMLSQHRGTLYRPSQAASKTTLACPARGSLESLTRRFQAAAKKLRPDQHAPESRYLFAQQPKSRFVEVAYQSPVACRLYALTCVDDESTFRPWPMTRATSLVERVRDAAAARLCAALPERAALIERLLVGRKVDATPTAPIEQRIRIVPLPSIGHESADRAIRRIAIEVPSGTGLSVADVHWAFSGLGTNDPETGELDSFVLTATADEKMLSHYRGSSRTWRTVTPAALPLAASRRRIEPSRRHAEAKGAKERSDEEVRASAAVHAALRHAGVFARTTRVRVQREPFEAKGARAENFAVGTRFAKERLWHVEIEFGDPATGPLIFGDGRFLGLGLAAPMRASDSLQCFVIERGLSPQADPIDVARAFRRAVLARVHSALGARSGKPLPAYFSGHDSDGTAKRAVTLPHVGFQFDPAGRLFAIAHHLIDHGQRSGEERTHLETLDSALENLIEVRAGSAGRLIVRRMPLNSSDAIVVASNTWVSVTPYAVNRHRKGMTAVEALSADLIAECACRNLPKPTVSVDATRGVPGRGLQGHVRLQFQVAVTGPLILGRTRYLGGGLFAAADCKSR